MLIVFLFLCFATIPISYGSPVDLLRGKTNSSTLSSNKILENNNAKKISIASEGGTIISVTPIPSLPKENPALLEASGVDMSSNKVKARKGAPEEGIENISTERNYVLTNVTKDNSKGFLNSSLSSMEQSLKIVNKPPILSAEMIAKSDLLNSDPAVDDVEERMIKIHKTNINGHPNMITPIVITVLVVPIFAMIGYMALKRGKEAWKNRHYKRMDFLLDGMYND